MATDSAQAALNLRKARGNFLATRVIAIIETQLRVARAELLPATWAARGHTDDSVARNILEVCAGLKSELDAWRVVLQRGTIRAEQRAFLLESARRQLALGSPYDPLSFVLEASKAYASRFPTPAQWQAFFLAEVVPALNSLQSKLRFCTICGTEFPLTRKDRRACSDGCTALARMRGRRRATGRLARTSRSLLLAERHMKKCARCKRDGSCPVFERLVREATRDTRGPGQPDLYAHPIDAETTLDDVVIDGDDDDESP